MKYIIILASLITFTSAEAPCEEIYSEGFGMLNVIDRYCKNGPSEL